jgi:hypothetical protein
LWEGKSRLLILKKSSGKAKTSGSVDQKSVFVAQRNALTEFYPLSGKEVLDRVLEHDRPRQLVQNLAGEDFYWLIKKVGDNDCLPLLELASEEQWQYLLDLELWSKDRMNMEQAYRWLGRLQLADHERLARWLFSEGQTFAYYFLFKSIQVEIKKEDEIYDLDQGFFTFDGLYFIKVLDNTQRDSIKDLLRTIADEDLNRYHALLLGLTGLLPAETEEEMYRLKNVRLAEHGFLPFEEALSIYSPLGPESVLVNQASQESKVLVLGESDRGLVPVSPLYHSTSEDFLAVTVSRITDGILLDRIALEFAGLCNQILSADGILTSDLEILIKTCRKASGYLNMALERLCGTDIFLAEEILRKNSLISIFQVGFGIALKLKWETEGWIKKSWFDGQGLKLDFWGDWWGRTLAGVMEKKPCLYVGLEKGEEYRDFEKFSELDECHRLVGRMMVLDRLFDRLAGHYPFDKDKARNSGLTFHQFLFNLWARHLLKLESCFSGISYAQVETFFGLLRANEKKPPYRMAGFEKDFIKYYMAYAYDFEPEATSTLKDTLSLIWQEFQEEHEWMTTVDPKGKYIRFVLIKPSHESPAQ